VSDLIARIAAEAQAAVDGGRQIASFSTRHPAFALDDGYRVAAAMRQTRVSRGERPVGRKIGFTNRTIWREYNVYAPIWGTMYDSTVHDIADLGGAFTLTRLAEPRIEPEIVFGLAAAPHPGMTDASLLATVAWVAHGFEIVQSIFPAWKFTPADTVAANGLHGVLMIGPRMPVARDADRWLGCLSSFEIDLLRDAAIMDRGKASNVLDGPLNALRHLVDLLAADAYNPPLAAGEIVTTGTLTRALPITPGETWSTALSGIPLQGISIRFA
jgi:2-oxo-3-hexenedioate decarboxylase